MSLETELQPLITVEQLQDILNEPHVKLFDVRGSWGGESDEAKEAFAQGHIPDAQLLDWKTSFLASDQPIALAPVAPKEEAQQAFNLLGINQGDTVVLYDEYHHMLAGRVWWAMRYWGFEQVLVLNGGFNEWKAQALSLSTGDQMPSKVEGNFVVKECPQLRTAIESVMSLSSKQCLIDARGPINFAGKLDDPRTGHIPGAVNLPYKELLQENGLFKSPAELDALLTEKLGDYRGLDLISSCGSGYAGTVFLLALAQLGIESPLFDDSFSVWKLDPERPVEQGLK